MTTVVPSGQLIPRVNRSKPVFLSRTSIMRLSRTSIMPPNRISFGHARRKALDPTLQPKSSGGPHPQETNANLNKPILTTILSLSGVKPQINRGPRAAIDVAPLNTL